LFPEMLFHTQDLFGRVTMGVWQRARSPTSNHAGELLEPIGRNHQALRRNRVQVLIH
jgi:hypothetical protein